MPQLRVILVEPKSEGNVGSVARAMKNFGVTDLALVKPPPLGDECRGRALHAWDVVANAPIHGSLERALQDCDYVVGTSARVPGPDKSYLRNPIDVRDLPPKLSPMEGRVALLFGREDFGLFNSELELCDLLVTIPSSPAYRSLNLSHAVAVTLYEWFAQTATREERATTPLNGDMRRHFQVNMDRLVDAMELPEHQARNVKTAYRKLFGRAAPSAWEYYVLMVILRRSLQRFGIEEPPAPGLPEFDLDAEIADGAGRLLE